MNENTETKDLTTQIETDAEQQGERRVNITTIDNPYDPFDDFEHWLLFDKEKGYNTSDKLGRLTNLRNDMSSVEENIEVEKGIDKLIEIDPLSIYEKIIRYDKKVRGE